MIEWYMKDREVETHMENGIVLDKREAFLEKIRDAKLREVVDSRLAQLEKRDKNEKRKKDIASIAREMLECDYVTLDEDTGLTFGDMMVATATANLISNPRTTFKEINDAQKVMDNDTDKMSGGFTVIVNTNGQDLGDEV